MKPLNSLKTVITLVPLAVLCILYGLWLVLEPPVYLESVLYGTLVLGLFCALYIRFIPACAAQLEQRSRSEEDRRVVLVSLSEKGEKAYFHHRMFHRADFYGNFISVYFEGRDMFFVCTVRSAGDQFRHFLSATDNRDAGIVHFCDDIFAVIADIEFYAHRDLLVNNLK